MPRLVVTVNDCAVLSHLKTAIKQLHGVEQVTTLRDDSVKMESAHNRLHQEFCQRIDALSQLADGWDGEGSKAIDAQLVKKLQRALMKAPEHQLDGWAIFPEAHGYLCLDYAGNNASAGITVMPDRMVYFIQKNGRLQKSNGIAFTLRNFLSILKRVNDRTVLK